MPETPYFLSHLHPHCTGEWRPLHNDRRPHWRCSRCSALYSDSERVSGAAIRENQIGTTLDQLMKEGRKLLEGA